MLNLSTDYYKVSIGSYFCALCGDYSALRIIKFIPTGATANRLACDKLTNSLGKEVQELKKEDVVLELIEVSQEIHLIHLFMQIFDLRASLGENMLEIAKNKGLLTDGMFDPFKANNRVKQLSFKRKIALAEMESEKPKNTKSTPLTKSTLSNQIAAINHAGQGGRGGVSLKSPVAEYFSELIFLDKLAKQQKQNG